MKFKPNMILWHIVDKAFEFIFGNPVTFWGVKPTITMEKQIATGKSRSDEELDALQNERCSYCGCSES